MLIPTGYLKYKSKTLTPGELLTTAQTRTDLLPHQEHSEILQRVSSIIRSQNFQVRKQDEEFKKFLSLNPKYYPRSFRKVQKLAAKDPGTLI